MDSQPPGGRLGTGTQASPFWVSLSESTAPHHPPYCFPFLGINLGTVLISQPCLFFLALLPLLSGDCPGPPWLPGGRLDWAAGPGTSVLHRVGQSDSRLLTSMASV